MVGRRWQMAAGLFLLAPFLGEYVLGNQALTALPWLIALAPMYGGGALIIRELGRRTRSGWPVMITLAAAYALVEEGLIDQMIFNPGYLDLPDFAAHAPIPGLGISASLTLDSLALHAIGSTCVPIAIMEAFDREPTRPWLTRTGLGVVIAIFVLGSTVLGVLQAQEFRFVGTPAQFGVTLAVIGVLVLVARRLAGRTPGPASGPPAPTPRRAGVVAFLVTTAFWVINMVVPSMTSTWSAVAGDAVVLAFGGVLLVRTSRRPGWGGRHRLAVACGALGTYLWLAFINTALLGVPVVLGLVGNVIFGAAAVLIMVLAWRREVHLVEAG